MKHKICPVCVIVSGTWLILSALVAWHVLPLATYQLPIALLMGGSVVGIAYQKEKYKKIIIISGLPVAYLLVSNLSKSIVIFELVLLLMVAYLLFLKRDLPANPDLEEKLKQCC